MSIYLQTRGRVARVHTGTGLTQTQGPHRHRTVMTTTAEKVATEGEKAVPEKRKALGRGLESLLPGGPRAVPGTGMSSPAGAGAATADANAHSTVLPAVHGQARPSGD